MEPDQIDSSTNIIKDTNDDFYQQEHKASQPVNFCQLFRFATRTDYIILAIGLFASMCNGAALPLFALLWGNMVDSFKTKEEMVDQAREMLLLFIYIGLGAATTGWIMITCWLTAGERQSIECRKQYLKSLLKQEIGWFDTLNQAEISSQFSADTIAYQEGISDKVPLVVYVISMAISGLTVSFIRGWMLTLVLLAIFPILVGAMYLYINNVHNKNKR